MSKYFNITYFTETGKRKQNEDSVYPNPTIPEHHPSSENMIFMVCDGMGGHAKGEVASAIVCSELPAFLQSNQITISNQENLNEALDYVEHKIDKYIEEFPEATSMGSTLTFVQFHQHGATLAHIGDSRIYQLRKGKIIHQSEDHSQVYALYKSGIITKEEMRTHPQNNIILKAIMGATVKPVKPEVHLLTDIQAGDIFFLCSDGVIEAFTDDEIEQVFSQNNSLETINQILAEKSAAESRDNYSGYIIEVKEEFIKTLVPFISVDRTEIEDTNEDVEPLEETIVSPVTDLDKKTTQVSDNEYNPNKLSQEVKDQRNRKKIKLVILLIIVLTILGYVLKTQIFDKNSETQLEEIEETELEQQTEDRDDFSFDEGVQVDDFQDLDEEISSTTETNTETQDKTTPGSSSLPNSQEINVQLTEIEILIDNREYAKAENTIKGIKLQQFSKEQLKKLEELKKRIEQAKTVDNTPSETSNQEEGFRGEKKNTSDGEGRGKERTK